MSIPYNVKSYEAVLAQINTDPELTDKPDWWKRMIAGLYDSAALWINAVANNTVLNTAFTRRAIEDLLRLIDYQLTSQSTATGSAIFYCPSTVVFPFTVQKEDLAALTPGTVAAAAKRFEARANSTVTSVTETINPADVNTGTDRITVSREFTTGEKVRFTTTGTLPAPLQLATDYYIIKIDATTIQVAETLAYAYAGTEIDLTTQGAGVHTATLFSFIATVYQQETIAQQVIGTSDGTTEFQEFVLPEENIIQDTIAITINAVTWTRVDTLIESGAADTHYQIIYDFDGGARILFGNGTYGVIPGAFDIYLDCAIGGGEDSNVTVVNRLNIYAGSDSNVNGVSNYASLTGGADVESTESAKILGPLLLKARSRFVTAEDGKALAESYAGIAMAEVIPNEYGVLSAKVVCIANGGGNPSGAVKTALQAYLIDLTVLESIDVRVQDTTITTQAVTSAAKMKSGYTYTSDVENYFRLAWKLWLSPSGYEIWLDYVSNGVASAITLLNTIFTESFDNTDADDLTQIGILLEGLEDNYRQIGVDVYESDTYAYIELVTGIDYLTISVPAAFPISVADDEITNYGALTLTEIP